MRNKGFTLVELVIVFVILAVLLVIAIPPFIANSERLELQRPYQPGDCVYHKLDVDGETKGLVLEQRSGHNSDVAVRFGINEGYKFYEPIELRRCSTHGTIRID